MLPTEGAHSWWSGRGDELNNTLSRTIDVPAGASVTVSSDLWYSIENGYDFLYAEYSTDGGARWTQVGRPITGDGAKWAGKRWSFKPAVAGDVLFQFRYATDGGVNEPGRSSTTSASRSARTSSSRTAPRTATTAGRSTAGRPRPEPR